VTTYSVTLTQAEQDAYQTDGVVCIRSVFTAEELAPAIQGAIDLLNEEPTPYDARLEATTRYGDNSDEGDPGRAFGGVYLSEKIPAFRELAYHPRLASFGRDLMGVKSVRFFYDQLFIRGPGSETATLWHNDLSFWPFEGEDLISCWIALSSVTPESSGVEYLAGSQHLGNIYSAPIERLKDRTRELPPDFSRPENRQGERILSWNMEPGDVLFHHPLVLHGAGGNYRATTRIGLSIRYLGDDVKWKPRDTAMKLPRDPDVPVGSFPADDLAFPVVV
jgi:ectoine hydroxylase-related dioxygenase (phytanoyl-CoA dioxygenase family)